MSLRCIIIAYHFVKVHKMFHILKFIYISIKNVDINFETVFYIIYFSISVYYILIQWKLVTVIDWLRTLLA